MRSEKNIATIFFNLFLCVLSQRLFLNESYVPNLRKCSFHNNIEPIISHFKFLLQFLDNSRHLGRTTNALPRTEVKVGPHSDCPGKHSGLCPHTDITSRGKSSGNVLGLLLVQVLFCHSAIQVSEFGNVIVVSERAPASLNGDNNVAFLSSYK